MALSAYLSRPIKRGARALGIPAAALITRGEAPSWFLGIGTGGPNAYSGERSSRRDGQIRVAWDREMR